MVHRQDVVTINENDSETSELSSTLSGSTNDIAQVHVELAELQKTMEVERRKLMNKYMEEENNRLTVEDALRSFERRSRDKESGADDGTRDENQESVDTPEENEENEEGNDENRNDENGNDENGNDREENDEDNMMDESVDQQETEEWNDQEENDRGRNDKDADREGREPAHNREVAMLKEKINLLEMTLIKRTFSVMLLRNDDKYARLYTGLPSWRVFQHVFEFVSPNAGKSISLSLEDELLLTLCRLRLALNVEDISVRFSISSTTASHIFAKWIRLLYLRLRFLIAWPSRELCHQNMPSIFKELYPMCRCVIDCSEIFIEMPNNYKARNSTYSNYKKHNTVKFLIGISPFGTISFLSQCWGGRVSDKVLTQESGFLNKLEHGDVILADRGFTITDDVGVHGAKLEIPAFTRGKTQLSQRDVEMSKKLSQVRIHVERVIGLLKNKYTLLQGKIPINMLKHKDDTNDSNIDRILVVCASLINLCKSTVPC